MFLYRKCRNYYFYIINICNFTTSTLTPFFVGTQIRHTVLLIDLVSSRLKNTLPGLSFMNPKESVFQRVLCWTGEIHRVFFFFFCFLISVMHLFVCTNTRLFWNEYLVRRRTSNGWGLYMIPQSFWTWFLNRDVEKTDIFSIPVNKNNTFRNSCTFASFSKLFGESRWRLQVFDKVITVWT